MIEWVAGLDLVNLVAGPLLTVAIIVVFQLFMNKTFFYLGTPNNQWLRNIFWFSIFDYLLVFNNMLLGLLVVIARYISWFLIGLITMGRMDVLMLPKNEQKLYLADAAFTSYVAIVRQDHQYNAPVVNAFFQILQALFLCIARPHASCHLCSGGLAPSHAISSDLPDISLPQAQLKVVRRRAAARKFRTALIHYRMHELKKEMHQEAQARLRSHSSLGSFASPAISIGSRGDLAQARVAAAAAEGVVLDVGPLTRRAQLRIAVEAQLYSLKLQVRSPLDLPDLLALGRDLAAVSPQVAKGSAELAKLKAKAAAMLPSKWAPPPPTPEEEAAGGAGAGGDAEAAEKEGERRVKMLTRYELADKSMGALRAVKTQTSRMGDTIKRHTSHVAKHFEAKEKKHPVSKKRRARNRWQVGALPS